jgi:zinc protease
MLLLATERGSRRYPGAALRTRTARLGTQIVVSPGLDWSMYGLRAIRQTFDSSWALFADRLINPQLADSEVELIRAQMVSGLQATEHEPDEMLDRLADSVMFIGHPYALSPAGTEKSIRGITPAQLREYHRSSMVTSRMLLVVVGNIERAKLESLLRSTFGTLPAGTYKWTPPPVLKDRTRAVALRSASLPTNYLTGYFAGPAATDRDYTALRVAMAVLAGRLFTEIRSRQNLSYAPDAPFHERAIATGGLYVTTVDPNAALRIMSDEIRRLQTETIERAGLERLVGQFITDYFMKNETNADQATFLARAAIYQGDYRRANRFVDELRSIRPDDVRRVANQYIRNFRFAYIGDPTRLDQLFLNRF